MSSKQTAAIEAEREKCNFTFSEEIAPGNVCQLALRRILVSTQSDFQKIDVLETFFGKTLVTDGKTQSTQFDEFAYHESLVHPSLLHVESVSERPLSVMIGGGGELATAREVLKHKSVSRLVMVDIDEKLVKICQEYLPEWGGDVVMKDPRFEIVFGDAHEYLLNCKETFDVIIMDISDPIEGGPGALLYTKEFYERTKTLLKQPNGVFVTQAGMAEAVPATVTGVAGVEPSCFPPIYNTLCAAFDHVVPYASNIPSFASDWGFFMASQGPLGTYFLDEEGKHPRPTRIDELIEEKISEGQNNLRWYDGITHLKMFSLSKPLRSFMANDDRVITKDNPLFMY